MTYRTIETQLANGVAVIWLNRPDVRNAMNDVLIAETDDAVASAIDDDDVRVIVLAGRGTAFCAGADLAWLQATRQMSPEDARKDAMTGLATLLRRLHESPKPTVARVHGPAFAGGMGLVAACDIAIASTDARFCLSEVKLGLIPATISPFVIRAMGERVARRYFLTAEVFDAAEAYRIDVVQDIAPPDELDAMINTLLGHLVLGGPGALREAKRLIRDMADAPINEATALEAATRMVASANSAEGKEGIASFFEKRPPNWVAQ